MFIILISSILFFLLQVGTFFFSFQLLVVPVVRANIYSVKCLSFTFPLVFFFFWHCHQIWSFARGEHTFISLVILFFFFFFSPLFILQQREKAIVTFIRHFYWYLYLFFSLLFIRKTLDIKRFITCYECRLLEQMNSEFEPFSFLFCPFIPLIFITTSSLIES